MIVRRELPGDVDAIAAVHRAAFAIDDGSEPVEVGLVEQLRADDSWIPELSMVCSDDDGVIGHVCLTRATVGWRNVLALGPIGVATTDQRAGVGSALMHACIGAADALGEPLIGLVGHRSYYPRFGFIPGAALQITPSDPDWTPAFQVRSLSAFDPATAGEFRYAKPFYDL